MLGKVKEFDFVVQELVTDKYSTTNAILCKHFPEGTVTYCSNHCTNNLHKHLEKLKKNKCEICQTIFVPLLFLYDCETTGLSIYNDHITDIASKVIACPVPLLTPSFSSLVKTSKYISAPGMPHYNYSYTY